MDTRECTSSSWHAILSAPLPRMSLLPPRVTHLYRKRKHRQEMEATSAVELISMNGIVGDASFGRNSRQVLLVSKDVLTACDLQPGEIRENIVIEGMDVDSLPPGTELAIGSSNLKVVGPCTPCARLDEIRSGLQDQLEGRRGILAQTITGGQIAVGDEVEIILP